MVGLGVLHTCGTTHSHKAPTLTGYQMSFLQRQLSTFLMLRPSDTVSHVVMTPNHKIMSLLSHNYNVAPVINCNVNIWREIGFRKGLQPKG